MISFYDRAYMAERLCDLIAAQLELGVARSGRARLAVSGGSTPALLYDRLSRQALAWKNVSVHLVDERWTPPHSPGSNETFVRQTLLQNQAVDASFEGFWREGASPLVAGAQAHAALKDQDAMFDVVILGMGDDGHTASWFPHADGLAQALSEARDAPFACTVRAKPSAVAGDHLDRVTLSLRAVKSAKIICLMIQGESKKAAFNAAAVGGPFEDAPVRAILKARPDLWVAWAP